MLLLIVFIEEKRQRQILIKKLIYKKSTKEKKQMTELAKKFTEKECIIYTFNGAQIIGTVKEVTDGGIFLEKDGNVEAINIDFVIRIREYPKKKNGKKKSVIID